MEQRQEMQEELLNAWMEMSLHIRGNRILDGFSFNEIMICGLLHRRRQVSGQPPLTATELGDYTRLLKSQINHILTSMESRGLIYRERAAHDKRVIYVHLREEALSSYLSEHKKVLDIVDSICTTLGEEDTKQLTALMRKATAVVNDCISKEES